MPTFNERLSSWIAGAPVGSRPLTRTEPYEVYVAERDRRNLRSMKAVACLIALMLAVTTCMSVAYAAQQGCWQVIPGTATGGAYSGGDTTTGNDDAQSTAKFRWRWVATSGDTPTSISHTRNGKTTTYDNSDSKTAGVGPFATAPTWAPDGWTINSTNQDEETDDWDAKDEEEKETDSSTSSDYSEQLIKDGVDFELSFDFIVRCFWYLLWSFCRGIVDLCLSIASWFLDLMGSNAEQAFTSDFSTGTFASFYSVAKEVSTRAFQPYALAFLGLVFGIALMRPFDPRRRMHGVDQAAQVVMTVAMLAVSTTLILHAIDLCGAIYWLAQNLVRGISTILEGLGLSPGADGFGESMRQQFLDIMDAITYGEAATSLGVLVVAGAALFVCVKCAFSVMTTIFLRVGEIYLRASASPLCLAFLIDDHSKQVGIGYMKRFGAVCAQAAIIFLALGMMPLFFEVATAFVSPVLPDASDIGGTGTVLAAAIPSLCAVMAIRGVVDKSEHIANSLFGLAG